VELDDGGELQAVRQNIQTSSTEALQQQGKAVEVGWLPEQAVPVGSSTKTEETRET
jgi:hypothetical protein